MVEEDQDTDAERKHIVERLGYIIFEVPFDVEQCTQFTGPAQTWDTSGSIEIKGSAKISGAVSGTQLGYFDVEAHTNNSCTVGNCVADNSLLVPMFNFASFTPVLTILALTLVLTRCRQGNTTKLIFWRCSGHVHGGGLLC